MRFGRRRGNRTEIMNGIGKRPLTRSRKRMGPGTSRV
jgi:hypothetical protein